MSASRRMGTIFIRHARRLLLSIVLLLVTLLAGIALLAVAGGFLTAAALSGGTALGFNFLAPSAGIRALTFTRILSRYGEKLAGHDVTLRIARDLRVWFFRGALPLAPARLGTTRMGELLARLMSDIAQVDGLFVRAIGPLFALAAMTLALLLAAAWLHAPAALLLAALALVDGVVVALLVARGQQHAEGHRMRLLAGLRSRSHDGLAGATDLAMMQATDAWAHGVDAVVTDLEAIQVARRQRLALGNLAHAVSAAVGLVAMLWLVLDAVAEGAITAPRAAALLFLTVAALELAAAAGLAWQALLGGRASWQRLRQLIAQPAPVADRGRQVPASRGDLHLRGACFAWPGAARPVLADADLYIPAGQRVAISGDSGSGKSTLAALLLRIVDPQAGTLMFGGINVPDLDLDAWYERIAWLPQDAPVFTGSVRENLLIAAPQADDARLWAVLATVRLAEWARTRDGLATRVGEHGAAMSAGQARRLVLAGALLRDVAIVVLDEPMAGLDVDTAHAVLHDLPHALAGRSLVIISHAPLPAGVVDVHHVLVDGRLRTADR